MSVRATADEAVFDVPSQARYELRLDGELAGFCNYAPRPGRLVLAHVEIKPEHRGRGLASRLVRAILKDVRSRGGLVEPRCPFAIGFLARNPEFSDLVFAPPVEPLTEGLKRT